MLLCLHRFQTAHIWACPPSEGDDYIFHCHPPEQKIPKPKRLQDWYRRMLDKAIADRVVCDYKACITACWFLLLNIFYILHYYILAVITRPPDGVLLAPKRSLLGACGALPCYSSCNYPSSGRSFVSVHQVSLSRSVLGVS